MNKTLALAWLSIVPVLAAFAFLSSLLFYHLAWERTALGIRVGQVWEFNNSDPWKDCPKVVVIGVSNNWVMTWEPAGFVQTNTQTARLFKICYRRSRAAIPPQLESAVYPAHQLIVSNLTTGRVLVGRAENGGINE